MLGTSCTNSGISNKDSLPSPFLYVRGEDDGITEAGALGGRVGPTDAQ